MKYGAVLFLLLSLTALKAQKLSSIGSVYSDDLSEWVLYAPDPESDAEPTDPEEEESELQEIEIGKLSPMFPFRDDRLTYWQYQTPEHRGTIRQKWTTDPTHWELSDEDSRITIQPTYPGDRRQWRITDNQITLNLRSRYGNVADEWILEDDQYGSFYMYTLREGDPRDWVIEDKLSEDIPDGMRMALTFTVMFFSTMDR